MHRAAARCEPGWGEPYSEKLSPPRRLAHFVRSTSTLPLQGRVNRMHRTGYFPPTSSNHSSSVSVATPCFFASASFDPAPGPATT